MSVIYTSTAKTADEYRLEMIAELTRRFADLKAEYGSASSATARKVASRAMYELAQFRSVMEKTVFEK